MASSTITHEAHQDWILANPWPWTLSGLGICLLNGASVLLLGESLNGLGLFFLFLGLICAGTGVALRLNSSAPALVEQMSPDIRRLILRSLMLMFALCAAVITILLVLRIFAINPVQLRLNALIILWVIVVPMSLAALALCARRIGPKCTVTPAEESAAVLAVAALAAFCATWALYNPRNPLDWDSLRMFLAVLFLVALAGVPLLLVSQTMRRLVVSLLILLHFGGICMASLSAPPTPWLVFQIWGRIYQPYLEFMYLNNAYHFYAPEPGPASYLWFRMYYESPQKQLYAHWVKIPDVDDKGWHKNTLALEYQRMLAATENTVPADPPPSMTITKPDGTVVYADWYVRRLEHSPNQLAPNIGQAENTPEGLVVPFHPNIQIVQQYQQPNAASKILLESYARHVCLQPHPTHPDWKIKSVKIYRVIHVIPDVYAFVQERMDPRDPANYRPYYMGHYDPQGNLLDVNEYDANGKLTKAADPFLYWLLPMLREPPAHLIDSPIKSWAARHAGDPDWIYTYSQAEKRHRLDFGTLKP